MWIIPAAQVGGTVLSYGLSAVGLCGAKKGLDAWGGVNKLANKLLYNKIKDAPGETLEEKITHFLKNVNTEVLPAVKEAEEAKSGEWQDQKAELPQTQDGTSGDVRVQWQEQKAELTRTQGVTLEDLKNKGLMGILPTLLIGLEGLKKEFFTSQFNAEDADPFERECVKFVKMWHQKFFRAKEEAAARSEAALKKDEPADAPAPARVIRSASAVRKEGLAAAPQVIIQGLEGWLKEKIGAELGKYGRSNPDEAIMAWLIEQQIDLAAVQSAFGHRGGFYNPAGIEEVAGLKRAALLNFAQKWISDNGADALIGIAIKKQLLRIDEQGMEAYIRSFVMSSDDHADKAAPVDNERAVSKFRQAQVRAMQARFRNPEGRAALGHVGLDFLAETCTPRGKQKQTLADIQAQLALTMGAQEGALPADAQQAVTVLTTQIMRTIEARSEHLKAKMEGVVNVEHVDDVARHLVSKPEAAPRDALDIYLGHHDRLVYAINSDELTVLVQHSVASMMARLQNIMVAHGDPRAEEFIANQVLNVLSSLDTVGDQREELKLQLSESIGEGLKGLLGSELEALPIPHVMRQALLGAVGQKMDGTLNGLIMMLDPASRLVRERVGEDALGVVASKLSDKALVALADQDTEEALFEAFGLMLPKETQEPAVGQGEPAHAGPVVVSPEVREVALKAARMIIQLVDQESDLVAHGNDLRRSLDTWLKRIPFAGGKGVEERLTDVLAKIIQKQLNQSGIDNNQSMFEFMCGQITSQLAPGEGAEEFVELGERLARLQKMPKDRRAKKLGDRNAVGRYCFSDDELDAMRPYAREDMGRSIDFEQERRRWVEHEELIGRVMDTELSEGPLKATCDFIARQIPALAAEMGRMKERIDGPKEDRKTAILNGVRKDLAKRLLRYVQDELKKPDVTIEALQAYIEPSNSSRLNRAFAIELVRRVLRRQRSDWRDMLQSKDQTGRYRFSPKAIYAMRQVVKGEAGGARADLSKTLLDELQRRAARVPGVVHQQLGFVLNSGSVSGAIARLILDGLVGLILRIALLPMAVYHMIGGVGFRQYYRDQALARARRYLDDKNHSQDHIRMLGAKVGQVREWIKTTPVVNHTVRNFVADVISPPKPLEFA